MHYLQLSASVVFMLLGLWIFAGFIRTRRVGLALGSFVYAAGGATGFVTQSWVPVATSLAVAWILRELGWEPRATPERMVRVPPSRGHTIRPSDIDRLVDWWLEHDRHVRAVAARSIGFLWEAGVRPPDDRGNEHASAALAARILRDLEPLRTVDHEGFIRYLDRLTATVDETLFVTVRLVQEYGIDPDLASPRAELEKIPNLAERRNFAERYLCDVLNAATLRIMGWIYKEWHGEPYRSPAERTPVERRSNVSGVI